MDVAQPVVVGLEVAGRQLAIRALELVLDGVFSDNPDTAKIARDDE